MVTYLTQLLSGWKCNCFVNACNCCNCLSVPLLEFGVTSPALSGTRWAVRLLFCVIRPLSATPLASHHCSGSKYTNFSETITVIIKNNKKRGYLYVYQLPDAHTENWRNNHPKHVDETHIFNWGRLASEIVMAPVMAARGWSNRDLVRGALSPLAMG